MNDILNELSSEKLRPKLSDGFGEIIIKDQTASTNDDAKALALSGAPDFSAVISKTQTSGKGQNGHGFVSDRGGLYLSVIACRGLDAKKASFITLAAAVAVYDAVYKICGHRPKIKWVNDLLLNNKKICGILTESRILPQTKELEFAVIGIGININNENFPKELEDKATSLFLDSGRRFDLNDCAAEVLNALKREIDNFSGGDFLSKYRENLIDPAPAENLIF
jgi:BirA family biotin operon repressor/biotin-[acetyl-CoA-carboxylase] ligase